MPSPTASSRKAGALKLDFASKELLRSAMPDRLRITEILQPTDATQSVGIA